MLFHSQIFVVVFLPVVLAGYYATAGSRAWRTAWLVAASLAFYAYWDPRLVGLLVVSILANWAIGRLLANVPLGLPLVLGVGANLLLLAVFKYADFTADALCALAGCRHQPWDIVLPLGISFFTFQQISYLVDVRRGSASAYRLIDYALYVSFFPQLIAGPIVRHDELIPQMALDPRRAGVHERLSRGAIHFVIGLAKKALVADQLARIADPLFTAANGGQGVLTTGEGWVAAIAFTLQIYFDFSAYSDMAIGLGLMFGFGLPVNFNAPYRSPSIREFWRRWHMTLSRFFRDYVYIPLGGNRFGLGRQVVALGITWFLTGLWHGAAWTFVAWGLIHGTALVVFLLWRRLGVPVPRVVGWALTMLVVTLAFVVFRAESFAAATEVYGAMIGLGQDGWAVRELPRLWLLGVAAVLVALPTSQRWAQELLPPRRWIAGLAALVLVYLLLELGSGQSVEFIYFQF
ncbi:MAG: MBOAT family protein [Rhodospirillaceae bacterium]|nr:MBOAT family protein [Rhodospirillaceae bacterium]